MVHKKTSRRQEELTDKDIIKELMERHTIKPFIEKIKIYDYNLYIHCYNVAVITNYLIDRLGNYTPEIKEEILIGALLHDVGKVYIPDTLLNKPAVLTTAEMQNVECHPGYGVETLLGFGFSDIVMDIVLHHHENEVGGGYPHHSISMEFETKIVSFADKYEAINNKRSYKNAMTHEATMREIRKVCGNYIDCHGIYESLNSFDDTKLIKSVR